MVVVMMMMMMMMMMRVHQIMQTHNVNYFEGQVLQAIKLFFLVGTGKTVTGAYLAYFFTQINKHVPAMGKGTPQVLYCGPSNKAVDVIASKRPFTNNSLDICDHQWGAYPLSYLSSM